MFFIIKKYQNLQKKNIQNVPSMWVKCVFADAWDVITHKNMYVEEQRQPSELNAKDVWKKFENIGGFRLPSFKRAYERQRLCG